MGLHCPHLGLQGDRHQVFLVPNPRHRCHVAGQPERVAEAHQGATCLTSSYRRCPRLAKARTPAGAALTGVPAAARDLPARYPNLRAMPQKRPARRPVTMIEVMVLGLVTSIVMAGCFVGYVMVHRMQVGPGMQAVAAVVTAPMVAAQSVTAEPSPTSEPALASTAPPATATLVPPLAPPTSIPEPDLPANAPANWPPAQSPPTRLTIARIGLDVPVLTVTTKVVQQGGRAREVWGDVPNAGGFHYTSAYPGNAGNTVINGHRDIQGGVFRHLDRVAVGDEIVLYVGDVAYAYQVTEILVVPETFASAAQQAENLRLIGPMPEERLTLVTCTPVGLATHRLLVIARPAEVGTP